MAPLCDEGSKVAEIPHLEGLSGNHPQYPRQSSLCWGWGSVMVIEVVSWCSKSLSCIGNLNVNSPLFYVSHLLC